MGEGKLTFHKIIKHGLGRYTLYCKKNPTAIVWVHFYKYIIFSSKPAI